MRSNSAHSSAMADEAAQRYAARMVYLTEDDEVPGFINTTLEPMGRTLKPPALFMSRRQALADSTLSAQRANKKGTASDPLRGVRAQAMEKKPLVARRNDAAVRGKQKSDNKRPIQADDFPETKPEHWRRVKEAGVMFWFNDVTGVATDDCPHESLWSLIERERELKERARDGKERAAVPKALDDLAFEVGQGEGTGALVYDSSEFEQAMRILDGAARTPGPSPATRTSH